MASSLDIINNTNFGIKLYGKQRMVENELDNFNDELFVLCTTF